MIKKYNNLMKSAKWEKTLEQSSYCRFIEQPTNRPHLHMDYMEFCFVIAGEGLFNHGGEVYRLKKDTLFVAHRGVIHEISSWASRDLELCFFLYFYPNPPGTVWSVCRPGCSSLAEYLPLLERNRRSSTEGTRLAARGFARDAMELLTLSREDSLAVVAPGGELEPLIEFIHDNLDRNFTVEDLAGQFAFSERSLRRKFAEATGMGLKKYILHRKIEAAGDLLMMHWRVNEAARAVGIDDPAQFSRLFKTHKGVSPREWQRSYLEKTGATFFL